MRKNHLMTDLMKYLVGLFFMLHLISCDKEENFDLQGEHKETILNLTQDLQVFYRSFHLANYCATDSTAAKRVFDIQVKNIALNTTLIANYKNTSSIYNPFVYNPTITSGNFELNYQNPYLSNFTYYAFLSLINVKNNNSIYNGKIYFNKSTINANQSYYYVYTDSLKVTTSNKTYYIKGNLTLNEQFNANASFATGYIESYNGMFGTLTIKDNFRAENDYKNRFGLKDKSSYNFISGKATFYIGNYKANLMIGDLPNSEGHVPSFNITDTTTRYFSPYPKF